MTTPVIFRKFKGLHKQVIALFPTIPGNYDRATCNSYMHLGQHGTASINITAWTTPAKLEEYKDLLEELQSIGYDDLVIYKRQQYWMYQEKIEALKGE